MLTLSQVADSQRGETAQPGTPRPDSQLCHLQIMCHQVSFAFSLFIYQMGQMQNTLQVFDATNTAITSVPNTCSKTVLYTWKVTVNMTDAVL